MQNTQEYEVMAKVDFQGDSISSRCEKLFDNKENIKTIKYVGKHGLLAESGEVTDPKYGNESCQMDICIFSCIVSMLNLNFYKSEQEQKLNICIPI